MAWAYAVERPAARRHLLGGQRHPFERPQSLDSARTVRGAVICEKYSPAQEGIFIYYPRGSRSQSKLRAFVDLCTRRI
jgi:hypothetical protein